MTKTASEILTERLRPGAEGFTEEQLAASERRLGQNYPPSFRTLVSKHGQFALHRPGQPDNTVFEVWPLEEHQTALARAADELGCDATAEAVSEELGIDSETIAVLEQIVLVGCEYDEDFVGFDLRTRHADTQEAAFVLQLMDDTEIEYLSQHPGRAEAVATGFESYLHDHARRTT